jgi:hypothetical protein
VIGDAGHEQGVAVGRQREPVWLADRQAGPNAETTAMCITRVELEQPVAATLGHEHALGGGVTNDLPEPRGELQLGDRLTPPGPNHHALFALDHQEPVLVDDDRAPVAALMRAEPWRAEIPERIDADVHAGREHEVDVDLCLCPRDRSSEQPCEGEGLGGAPPSRHVRRETSRDSIHRAGDTHER